MARHSIEVSEENGIRYLHFGSQWIQGAMRVVDPDALELEYTQKMMFCLLLAPEPRRVLLVGLGAASLLKFLYRHLPRSVLTVVEIDARVIQVAAQHFHLPQDPVRIRLGIADGREFVRATKERFDLILVDGFDAKARAGSLDTQAFYEDCRRSLARPGLLVTNLFGRVLRFPASVRRLGAAFDGRVLLLPPCSAGNVIAMAAHGAKRHASTAALRSLADELKRSTGLNLSNVVARLAPELAAFGHELQL
jgi:spermidine synthase